MPDTTATGSSTPVSPLDAATVLENAADQLLVTGRCKGHIRDADGRVCVLGALSDAASPSMALYVRAEQALIAHLAARGVRMSPERLLAVAAQWNDATDDDDEVRDTLLLVAKDLRNEARLS